MSTLTNSGRQARLATVALTEYDSETRFRARAARGSKEAGLALLAKLDRAFQKN